MAKLKDKEPYPSPFLGKYLIRNRLANYLLTLFDFVLSISVGLFIKKRRKISPPSSILLSNPAHLGDIIMSTAILPVLKKAFPGIKIGIVVGSWAKMVIQGHPGIDFVHTVDHWKANRTALPFHRKFLHYRKTLKKALKEIKALHYDVSVDLCYYFPNLSPLMWRAKIPTRIGYITAGCAALLTHPRAWIYKEQSVADYFFDLLSIIGPLHALRQEMRTSLPPIRTNSSLDISYFIIHMGSGNPVKEWPLEKWRELTIKLVQKRFLIMFTGKGEKEQRAIEEVTKGLPNTRNLCDDLSWEEFVALITNAELLIGVDTSAGHIAGAVNTPTVLIYSGINPLIHFSPYSKITKILTHPVPCLPCFRMRGCPSTACVRKLSVETVYDTVLESRRCISSQSSSKKRALSSITTS